jgi:hypothetical protein
VAVFTGHRLPGDQRIDDRLLGRVHDGVEDGADPVVRNERRCAELLIELRLLTVGCREREEDVPGPVAGTRARARETEGGLGFRTPSPLRCEATRALARGCPFGCPLRCRNTPYSTASHYGISVGRKGFRYLDRRP